MTIRIIRRTATATLAVLTLLVLAGGQLWAQPVPNAGPVCGGGHSKTNVVLYNEVPGTKGENYVSIPFVSNIHNPNGFTKLCQLMGLFPPNALPSIDGDGTPDNAQIRQFDGNGGTIETYLCDQSPPPAWTPGQGVLINIFLSAGGSSTVTIGGNVCTQPYASYLYGGGKGTQIAPLPVPTGAADRLDVCTQLNLPTNTEVSTVDASAGNFETVNCGQALDGNPAMRVGEAVRIRGFGGAGSAGDAVNCATPPCSVPAGNAQFDYPCALIFPGAAPAFCN